MTFSLLPIEDVHPHPDNVRRDLGDLTELTNSIKAQGVLQPIVVVPSDDALAGKAMLIAGHRRLAASKAAGLGRIPAIVRTDLTTRAAQIEAMLVENLHRSDLTVMEEAFAYEQLELLGVKVAAIAQATGRARATIESRKALTRLPEPARARVDEGDLTLDDAAFIAKHMDDEGLAAIIEKNIATSGHMIRWHVEQELRLREIRARQADAATESDDDEDSDADDWDADDDSDGDTQTWEELRAEREAREAAREAALKMRRDWVAEQVANDSATFWEGVIRYTIYATLNDDESDAACEILDLQKWEDSEDDEAWAKWLHVTVTEIMDRGLALRFLALTRYDTDVLLGMIAYIDAGSAADAHAYLGYPLTPYEQELIDATGVTRCATITSGRSSTCAATRRGAPRTGPRWIWASASTRITRISAALASRYLKRSWIAFAASCVGMTSSAPNPWSRTLYHHRHARPLRRGVGDERPASSDRHYSTTPRPGRHRGRHRVRAPLLPRPRQHPSSVRTHAVNAVHTYPVQDRFLHEGSDECSCGPAVTSFFLNGRFVGRQIIHCSIEGNYELRRMLALASPMNTSEDRHIFNLLSRQGIRSMDQLTKLTAEQLSLIRGIGPSRLKIIQRGLAHLGLSLNRDTRDFNLVACPKCPDRIELPVKVVQELDEAGGLSIELHIEPYLLLNHAARHVWTDTEGPQ